MKSEICPFLGLEDDPSTSLEFPSQGNFCHGAKGVRKIPLKYQNVYCLKGEHIRCPIYQQHAGVVPAPLAAGPPRTNKARFYRSKWFWAAALILLLLPTTVGLAAAALPPGQLLKFFSPGQPPGIIGNANPIAPLGLIFGEDSTQNATPLFPQASSVAANANCPIPPGWVTYTVLPTDSIYRLSELYSVSLADLQKANCLGSQTLILPGEILFVPEQPTQMPIGTDIGQLLQIPVSGGNSTPLPNSSNPSNPNSSFPPALLTNTPTVTRPTFPPNPSATPFPIATSTNPALPTSIPPFLPTATATLMPGPTALPTQTALPTNTPRPTRTPRPTNTPWPTLPPFPTRIWPTWPPIFPTNTPVPIQPTDPPVPPTPVPQQPTDTPIPVQPTPVPIQPTDPPPTAAPIQPTNPPPTAAPISPTNPPPILPTLPPIILPTLIPPSLLPVP